MEIDISDPKFNDGFVLGTHICTCARCNEMYTDMIHKIVTGCPVFIELMKALPRKGGE